jgi:hypothetical protein
MTRGRSPPGLFVAVCLSACAKAEAPFASIGNAKARRSRQLLAVLALASLCACRREPATPFNLRIAVHGGLVPVAPRDIGNWTVVANQLVFEPLIYLNNGGQAEPMLASRVEPLPPRALRVWLRDGASFSDGTPVTFEDVLYSLDRSHLRATHEKNSILIESDDPSAPVEAALAITYIHRNVHGTELGTGGFVLAEEDERHILLRRRTSSPGHVGSISIVSYDTAQEAFAHVLKGDAEVLTEVDPRWVELLEGVPRLRVMRLPTAYANVIAFNYARLSREERLGLVDLFRGDQVRALAFGDECEPPDRPAGGEMPAGSGGRKLNVLAASIFERFGLAVGRMLGERGGPVRIENLMEFTSTMKAGDYDLMTLRPRIAPPILTAQNLRSGSAENLYGYANPRVDAAFDAHDWAALERELAADPPFALICNAVDLKVMDSRIKNVSNRHFWANLVNWEVQQ